MRCSLLAVFVACVGAAVTGWWLGSALVFGVSTAAAAATGLISDFLESS